MLYGAIDLHLRRSHVRVVDEEGALIEERRIATTREAFEAMFGAQPRMRVLLESGTEAEWVAQRIEACGHEVIVADPNYVAMYATRSRRVKTDRRDVAALAEACRTGIYRPAHRVSPAQRQRRQQLRVRRQLVRIRTQLINLLRATLRQEGMRLPGGHASRATRRLAQVPLPPALAAILTPVEAVIDEVTGHLAATDAQLDAAAVADAAVRRSMTLPGVGPIVALTFHATLDTPVRFAGDARRAAAFVGLVPTEHSSGERQQKGRITKAGSRELRSLLVQASWVIWRSRTNGTGPLRAWAQALAARRGKRIAIVALARRLTRILFAMWRDETVFRGAIA